jgi:hypothetical protein
MAKKKPKPGPTPHTLKINGDWKTAMKKSLTKKKPAKGWPKEPTTPSDAAGR